MDKAAAELERVFAAIRKSLLSLTLSSCLWD